MIQGLERIADGPAVDALLANANSPSADENVRSLTRGALVRIENSTEDVEIKEKIKSSRQ